MATVSKDEQSKKENCPISVTLSGNMISLRDAQLLKAPIPTLVKPLGSVIEVSFSQPSKA